MHVSMRTEFRALQWIFGRRTSEKPPRWSAPKASLTKSTLMSESLSWAHPAPAFIPVVATLRPIEHLVFICAGLPDIGRSATDQINRDGVLHEEWRDWTGGFDTPEAATRFMFNDCDAETLDWSLTTVRLLLPLTVYDEVTPLQDWPSVPATYVLGMKDRIINQAWARRAASERLGVTPIEVPSGHCPQNSRSELLAEILRGVVVPPPSS